MPVSWLVSVPVALDRAPPDWSCTVPSTSAFSNCAWSKPARRKPPKHRVILLNLVIRLPSSQREMVPAEGLRVLTLVLQVGITRDGMLPSLVGRTPYTARVPPDPLPGQRHQHLAGREQADGGVDWKRTRL